jgi:hypothetical protein
VTTGRKRLPNSTRTPPAPRGLPAPAHRLSSAQPRLQARRARRGRAPRTRRRGRPGHWPRRGLRGLPPAWPPTRDIPLRARARGANCSLHLPNSGALLGRPISCGRAVVWSIWRTSLVSQPRPCRRRQLGTGSVVSVVVARTETDATGARWVRRTASSPGPNTSLGTGRRAGW